MPVPSAVPVFYLISGLAADERIFANLKLEGEVVYIPWLSPQSQDEPLDHYAERMAALVEPDRPGLLAGVSFGGIVALEIARHRPWLKVVQISAISDPSQMPWHLRLIRWSGLYKITPPQLMKLFPRIGSWFFGTQGREEYLVFKQILEEADPWYMRWAIKQLLNWQPGCRYECVQLAGTCDTLFPPRLLPEAIRIQGGTHLMVYSEAVQISRLLNDLAREWTSRYTSPTGS